MRATICLLILAAVASASHLERRNSAETRSPGGNSYGAPTRTNSDYDTPSYGGDNDYPSAGGYGKAPAAYGDDGRYPSSGGYPSSGAGKRPRRRPAPARERPYGGGAYQPTSTTCTDGLSPTTQTPVATSTCTDDIAPTHVPSGVQDVQEQVCPTVTVTATQEVPVTQTVTETVDRPVTKTETVEVTSVKIEPTTIVQPVYQTETVTCTETLPAVYHTVEKTVEHTAYVTATQTVYPQPTQAAVSDAGEQQAYTPKPSAYQQAAPAAAVKPSAY